MPPGSRRSAKMKTPTRQSKIGCRFCRRSTKMKAPRREKVMRKPRNSTTMVIRKGIANASDCTVDFRTSLYCSLSTEQRDDHFTQKCPILNQLRKNNDLCDVTLLSGNGVEINAHKVVLSGVSQYFYTRFTKYKDEDRLLLTNFYSLTLESLVKYAYTSDIVLDENNIEAILGAADYFCMETLKNVCCNFLSSEICLQNCVHIRSVADRYFCTSLLDSCDNFIKKHFMEVIKDEKFMDFPLNLLKKMIQDDDLNVVSEITVYTAVMKWLKHDLENRQNNLYELMRYVRLPFLGRDRLSRIFFSDPLFEIMPDVIQMVKVQRLFFHALEEESSLSASSLAVSDDYVPIPRVSYSSIPKMFVIGGASKRIRHRTVDCFDIRSTKKHSGEQLSDAIDGAAAVSTRNKIYVTCDDEMRIFDLKANVWIENVDMPSHRAYHGSVLLDNKIYVIGGRDRNSEPLKSVEYYCLEEKEWYNAPDMTEARAFTTAAVLNGMIYVIGGTPSENPRQPLDSVEIYNPVTSTWKYCKNMNHARYYAAATVADNLLYVVGGHDDGKFGNRFEVYDPNTDKWELMPNLPVRRKCHGVCHDNGYLFVVGGWWNSSDWSIYVFCLLTRQWFKMGAELDVPRWGAAVVMAYESPD